MDVPLFFSCVYMEHESTTLFISNYNIMQIVYLDNMVDVCK